MFIGHFAPAFAARAISSDAPKLGTLFVAAQLVDWAFFLAAIVGIEHYRIEPGFTVMKPFFFYDYPWTHSLLGSFAWATLFGLVVGRMTRSSMAGIIAACVVLSHWVLDFISHGPDLTLAGGPDRFGLGLWNYPIAAVAIELVITLGAFWIYVRRTRGPVVPPLILLAGLLVLQAFDWLSPAPEQVSPVQGFMALIAFAILTLLAAWVGSTRWHKREVGLAVASTPR